jgi:hypothetical protein
VLWVEGDMVVLVAGGTGGIRTTPAVHDCGDGGPAVDAELNYPAGVAFDARGNLYISDMLNARIRRVNAPITPSSTIETYAGKGALATAAALLTAKEEKANGNPAALNAFDAPPPGELVSETLLMVPMALCFDAKGNLYVAENGSTLKDGFDFANGMNFADLPAIKPRIRVFTPAGKVYVLAGAGGRVFTDPDADDSLRLVSSLAFDPQGNLVVVDGGANQIKIIPAETFAKPF